MWHSLKENGEINFYDVRWSNGYIETDVSATLLEKVKDSDDISEAHPPHNESGHEENLPIKERKYKKKKKKNKLKGKKKKKNSLYPYVFGSGHHNANDHEYDANFGDFGGGFGDGGGGE